MNTFYKPALSMLLGAGLLAAAPALAQDYPTKPVRIITAGAGTFHDIVARRLSQRLSEIWGQPVVVENQPAAGLTIGSTIAAKAAPDGYTLLLADRTALAVAPHVYSNLQYHPLKDFKTITLVARAPSVLVAHPAIPAKDLREFVDHVRKQAAPVLFASAGVATVPHLTGELFRQLTGVQMLTVQYKGGNAAAMAVLSGEANFTSLTVPVVLPHINSGKLKPLALASAKRFAGAPDIPTGAEAGLPGFEAEQWVGMVAPAGVPQQVADRLNRDIVRVLRMPEISEALRSQGGEAAPSSPIEFASFVASESARLKKLVEAAGLRIDKK